VLFDLKLSWKIQGQHQAVFEVEKWFQGTLMTACTLPVCSALSLAQSAGSTSIPALADTMDVGSNTSGSRSRRTAVQVLSRWWKSDNGPFQAAASAQM
jgi:hypothetical protein